MKSKRAVSSKKPARSEQAQVARLYQNIKMEKQIFTRWFAGAESTVSTTAGGVVALATLANAAGVSALSDFSSMATVYTTYRVKAIRVDWFPVVVVNTTAITVPPIIAVFPSFANTVPTTFQQALDSTGLKLCSGYKQGSCMTSWKGDPDAHLWTGTGSAIGNNEQFLISCIGTAATSTASTAVWRVIPQYLVEFRIAG